MKEFNIKVWLPEDTVFCDDPGVERCQYLIACNCILLDKTLATNSRGQVVKHNFCPSLQKGDTPCQ